MILQRSISVCCGFTFFPPFICLARNMHPMDLCYPWSTITLDIWTSLSLEISRLECIIWPSRTLSTLMLSKMLFSTLTCLWDFSITKYWCKWYRFQGAINKAGQDLLGASTVHLRLWCIPLLVQTQVLTGSVIAPADTHRCKTRSSSQIVDNSSKPLTPLEMDIASYSVSSLKHNHLLRPF